MPDVAHLLETLHPMREPPPPLPVAPFLATAAVGLVLAAAAVLAWRAARRRRAGLRRSAEAALASTRDLAPGERLAAQARLLRRLVRTLRGEADARAQGPAWLAALDRAFATTLFTDGAGRVYAEALYRRDGAADVEALDRTLAGLFARLGSRSRARARPS